jgi:hypothetical protein
MLGKPTESNEFVNRANELIDNTIVEKNDHSTSGSSELTGAAILTAAEQKGRGTIDDMDGQTGNAGSPSIETTTSVTPDALASQTIKPALEAEKDEAAGSFATSEQQASPELESTIDHAGNFLTRQQKVYNLIR